MPARNIHLTNELDEFVEHQVSSGTYSNASEVVRAGLLALRDQRELHRARIEALRTAVLHGINSGVAEGDVIGELRQHIRNRAAARQKKTA